MAARWSWKADEESGPPVLEENALDMYLIFLRESPAKTHTHTHTSSIRMRWGRRMVAAGGGRREELLQPPRLATAAMATAPRVSADMVAAAARVAADRAPCPLRHSGSPPAERWPTGGRLNAAPPRATRTSGRCRWRGPCSSSGPWSPPPRACRARPAQPAFASPWRTVLAGARHTPREAAWPPQQLASRVRTDAAQTEPQRRHRTTGAPQRRARGIAPRAWKGGCV